MIRYYREIENHYIENFSKREDKEDYVYFWDDKLPDMYAFNCYLIKETMEPAVMGVFFQKCLEQTREVKKDFVKIFVHPKVMLSESVESQLRALGFEISTNLYMRFPDTLSGEFLSNEDCIVKRPSSQEEYEAGRALDVEASIAFGAPEEFVIRKALHKKEIFQQSEHLFSYVCFHQGEAIGSCELFIDGEFGKIEDFIVLERFQRKGFGTAILKKAISEARDQGAKNIYLITGKDDTPRNMYSKLGFEIIGQELELFWRKEE